MRKTKILYLITGLNIGGAEVFLLRFLRRLDFEKYEPVVVSFIPPGEIGKKIEDENVRVKSLGITKVLVDGQRNTLSFVKRVLAVLFKEFPRLIKIIKEEKPDIIHAHLFHANFTARITRLFVRTPVIISTIHNINFGGKLREICLSMTDFLGDTTIAISEEVASQMVRKKVVPQTRILSIQNGIDPEEFSRKESGPDPAFREMIGVSKDMPMLVSVGRLAEQKGYPFLIEAVSELKQRGVLVAVYVLGEGEDRVSLEQMVSEKCLSQQIFFVGSGKNVRDYLFAADVFLMPSLWEGLPIALLEAMVSGVPVIGTEVGGIPEVVKDTSSGFLVPPADSTLLADTIVRVLNLSRVERDILTDNAKRIVLENFSLDKTYNKYEAVYTKLLSEKGSV